MTRKHFEAIAYALAYTRPNKHDEMSGPALAQWERTRAALASACGEMNPNFNRARFMDATEKDAR